MSQPIITTDISAIRPVFSEGTAENIKRYTQLKKMFAQGKEYSVLAEPMLDGPDKITWHTEFEGTPQAFSKLTEDEQNAAKGMIKYQVNKLYKAVFKQLYHNDMQDVADMFSIIDSCIEIPDYDNIYRIQNADGRSRYVLIKWGFISDDFNAKSELVKKLVPTKVDTVKIKVIKSQKTAPGESITVVYKNKPILLTTDSKGYVYLEDIPLGDTFVAVSQDKETEIEYMCDGRDEYHFLIGTKCADMNFLITDDRGLPLSDTEVSFTYDGRTYFETSDSQGRIRLRDIPEGTEVVVKQKNAKNSYFCDASKQEYVFEGIRPSAEVEVAVMSEQGEFLPGIDVKFSYLDKDLTVSTDRNGRVSIDHIPPDTEFKIECGGGKFQKVSTSLITHEGLNMAEVKVRKISSSGRMSIKVVDEKQKPVVNTLVRCEYDDMRCEFYTDENGEILLDKVNYNSNVVCTQIINGLATHRHVFIFKPEETQYVFKGGMILERSEVTDLEILVVNKQKKKIPNLRVTIDDGHKVETRITDKDGRILIPGLKHGKYVISTEYNKKITQVDYTCSNEKELLKLVVGSNKLGFLIWLIPLILLLGWLIYSFLIPKVKEIASEPIIVADTVSKNTSVDSLQQNKPDTTQVVPVTEPEVKTPEGLTLAVWDEKTSEKIPGAKIVLEFGQGKKKTKLEGIADENGVINFKDVPMDSTLKIDAKITMKDHPDYITSFLFVPEKKILIPEVSTDISDVPVPCGQQVVSKGFHSTLQTINLGKTSGTVTIGFDTFDIPDELIVYNGKSGEISDAKIIYRTDGFVKGPFKKASFKFDSPDGLITVRVNGGDNSKTQWYFKVYCPSKGSNKSKK